MGLPEVLAAQHIRRYLSYSYRPQPYLEWTVQQLCTTHQAHQAHTGEQLRCGTTSWRH